MASGSAGKVYFVLYLAVILELLIIIVERDEAEEHLLAKQKESMKILESILGQMQTGAGSEGINTRPQDQITLKPAGYIKEPGDPEIKEDRTYVIEVGVTDVSNMKIDNSASPEDKKDFEKKRKMLANVQELEYQVFYNSSEDPNNAPVFIMDDVARKTKFAELAEGTQVGDLGWQFQSMRKIELDVSTTQDYRNPIYKPYSLVKGPSFVPPGKTDDSAFTYSQEKTDNLAQLNYGNSITKRAFMVRFQPPVKGGWYKLRFSSRTNKVLGVASTEEGSGVAELNPEAKINIGTVQLKVKDLIKVEKELRKKLGSFSVPTADDLRNKKINLEDFNKRIIDAKSKAAEIAAQAGPSDQEKASLPNRVELYGYIAKLLAPGLSQDFEQNRGSIEFNVFVMNPPPRPTAPPKITLETDLVRVFEGQGYIEVPCQVFPSSGNPKFSVKDIAGAEIRAGNSAATTGEGFISKILYIPIQSANTTPGSYNIKVAWEGNGKISEEVPMNVQVFPSKQNGDVFSAITNPDDIESAFDLSMGDLILLPAAATAATGISPSEFSMNVKSDNGVLDATIKGKLRIDASDAKYVPESAKSLNFEIYWKSRYNEKDPPLLIYKKSFEVNPPRPRLRGLPVVGSPNQAQIFDITNFEIEPPSVRSDDGNTKLGQLEGTPEFAIDPSDVKIVNLDAKEVKYTLKLVGSPKQAGNKFTIQAQLIGPRYRPGRLKGSFRISVKASSVINGQRATKSRKYTVQVGF